MKAKLSDKYNPDKAGSLTQEEADVARYLIRQLHPRAYLGHKVTSAYAASLRLSVDRGKIHHENLPGGRAKKVLGEADSVNDVVCEAVRLDLFPPMDSVPKADREPEPEPVREPEPPKVAEPAKPAKSEYRRWLEKVWALREYGRRNCMDPGDIPDDDASIRIIKGGWAMMQQGIPFDACAHAYAINWSRAARAENQISDYDPGTFGSYRGEGIRHKVFPYVMALIRAGLPVFLSGPAGTGKSTLGEHVAEELGLTFRSLSLVSGSSPAWINGRVNPVDGFVNVAFGLQYEDGGVMLIDEVANGSPDLLTGLNSAIANGYFENPVTGRQIPRHEDSVILAADNTWGDGANPKYSRKRLDPAFLDRFRMGRVLVDYDREIELALLAQVEREGA